MIPNGRSVLGIDAAWTTTQPSGVALVVEGGGGWRLAAVRPSYGQFIADAGQAPPNVRPTGCVPNVPALLAACEMIYPAKPVIVAVDMPLSMMPITARRASDQRVSVAYGKRDCSTHSPNSTRPGVISDNLRADFADAGYELATSALIPKPALIEVYPHPALVELARAERRLPYKIAKVRKYWVGSTPLERKQQVIAEWAKIVALLDERISGVSEALPPPHLDAPITVLKAYEDQIDAVVCAWVATCALEGSAVPFGDADSAIWIPAPLA